MTSTSVAHPAHDVERELRRCGLRVGRCTGPHPETMRERTGSLVTAGEAGALLRAEPSS